MSSESDDSDFVDPPSSKSKIKPSKVTPTTKEHLTPKDNQLSIFVRTTSYTKSKSHSSKRKGPSKNGKKITPKKLKLSTPPPRDLRGTPSLTTYFPKKYGRSIITEFKVSGKSNSMVSKHNNYPASVDDPMPGDLVMATISDINLPLLSSDVFGRSALIFGKVKCFTYVNGKKAMISAFGIVKDLELMKVEWSVEPGRRVSVPVDLSMMWVKVVAKRDDADISHANKFVVDEARRHFYFARPEGWMGVDMMVKGEADC